MLLLVRIGLHTFNYRHKIRVNFMSTFLVDFLVDWSRFEWIAYKQVSCGVVKRICFGDCAKFMDNWWRNNHNPFLFINWWWNNHNSSLFLLFSTDFGGWCHRWFENRIYVLELDTLSNRQIVLLNNSWYCLDLEQATLLQGLHSTSTGHWLW